MWWSVCEMIGWMDGGLRYVLSVWDPGWMDGELGYVLKCLRCLVGWMVAWDMRWSVWDVWLDGWWVEICFEVLWDPWLDGWWFEICFLVVCSVWLRISSALFFRKNLAHKREKVNKKPERQYECRWNASLREQWFFKSCSAENQWSDKWIAFFFDSP